MSPEPDPRRARLLVVGPGSLGLSLAAALSRTDLFSRVEVRGRSAHRPAFLDDHPAIGYSDAVGWKTGEHPAALLFCVPDADLAEAVRTWAAAVVEAGPDVALHVSGGRSPDPLEPFRELGVPTGVWHPLVAVPAPDPGALRRVAFGVGGDAEACRAAQRMSAGLEGRVLRIAAGEHARYHAAAVFASNYLVACLGVALDELGTACEDPPSPEDLLPLARSAVENVAREGPRDGATGPVVRGETEILERHLRALDPERRELYLRLADELLELVRDRMAPERVASLLELTGRPQDVRS